MILAVWWAAVWWTAVLLFVVLLLVLSDLVSLVLVDPSGGGSRLLRPAGSIASCRKIMIL